MKKIVIFIICLLITIIVVSSLYIGFKTINSKVEHEQKDPLKKHELNENEYALTINNSVKINNELTIKLIKISDSRCPKDVECVWEGELEYSLLINDNNYIVSTVLNKHIKYDKYLIDIVEDKCDINTLVLKIERND